MAINKHSELLNIIERQLLSYKQLVPKKIRSTDNEYKTLRSISTKLKSYEENDMNHIMFTRTEVRLMIKLIETTINALKTAVIPTYEYRLKTNKNDVLVPTIRKDYEKYLTHTKNRVKLLLELSTMLNKKL